MILVTGGTGFLGAYIIRELVSRGIPVRATRRATAKMPFFIAPGIVEKVEWVEADILDVVALEDAMQGVECIIHSAAVVSFNNQDTERMMQTNVEGTANIVNLALDLGIPRLVHISSVAALGRTKNDAIVTEGKPWEPTPLHTSYAVSKFKGEMEVWRAIAEGLNAVILNPSTIMGYGDWNQSSCAIFKHTFNEFPYYTNGINGFVAVEDVARAAADMVDAGHSNERFIVSGENRSFRNLLNSIADGFHKKRPQKEAGPLLSALAWRVEKLKWLFTGSHPLLTKESAKVAQSKTSFDNTRIKEALPGFVFTPLDTSIATSCAAYLEHFTENPN